MDLLPRLFAVLVSDPELAAPYLALAQGAHAWAGRWEEAILKVRETEFALLACLPLVALLDQVEAACLADPQAEALRITRLYQSPLQAPEFMARVLALLDSHGEHAAGAALSAAPMTGWLQDQDKDALWKLYTRQLEGLDYPFEQVLPQPWEHPVPNLLKRLSALLQQRFAAHVHAGRHQAVDYALEVFRRQPSLAVLNLVLQHARALLPQHYYSLLELVAHLPDARFLPLLVSQYREGEQDLQRLIRFVCDVHQRPYPKAVLSAAQEPPHARNHASLRLVCVACHGAFHYTLPVLFVDEERLEQRQIPQAKDLWCPHAVQCKQCGAPVPLEPDEHFLSDLYSELLAARMFALTGQEHSAVENVRLIPFPTLEGRTLNPAEFLERVYRQLAQPQEAAQTLPLLAELGRFQLEVGNLAEAKAAFRRILAGPVAYPAALYYLGVIAFQEKNLFEARVHFSRL
ncbi:MAG TPA: hypothetical protein VL359_19080, partial [bacterium]|nr:hypothetical protein [bacterium]